MNLLLFLIPVFFLILVIPAYAQSTDNFIFVQNILRDSDGNLVTTHQVTKIGFLAQDALDQFLDEEASSQDPVINLAGQKMQVIERAITLDFDSNDVLSDTTLNIAQDGDIRTLVRLIHDGVPVTAGDQITTIWTFIRPVG